MYQALKDFYDLIFQTDDYKKKEYDKKMEELRYKQLGPFRKTKPRPFVIDTPSNYSLDIKQQKERFQAF